MPKALIVYASRTGETENIANLIAEGIRMSGVEAKVTDLKSLKTENDINGYDAYAFGSATYHGDMLQGMKTFLFLAEKADLEGRQPAPSVPSGGAGKRRIVSSAP